MANNISVGTSVKGVGKASSDLDRFRDKFDKLQKQGAKGFAIGAGAAVTAKGLMLLDTALAQIGSSVAGAIDDASDLNETLSKSGVVFGENAGQIDKWGDTTADAMGIAKNASVGAAAGFGDLFNKMDETRGASAEMSTSLVGLAADIASFQNLDPTEVLDKLRAGLAGEAEPLRRVGVFLNEAKVKAKALEMGFVPLNGVLTDGAKIAARYALIMEETTSAQGDFARTSDQLANKQRQLQAKLDDLSATVGQKLIPVATELATVMVDDVIPALESMAPALDTIGEAVGGALETLGPFVDLLGAIGDKDVPKATNAVEELGRAFADFLNPGIPALAREFADAEAQIAENAAKAEAAVGGLAGRGFAGMAGAQARARDLADSVKGIATQSRKTARNVGDDLRAIVGAFQTAKEELTTLGQDTADAIYDPVIARGKLAIVEAELVKESKIANSQEAAEAEIDDLERTGKMTRKQARAARRELREQVQEAQIKVAELQKERIGLIAELQAFGKLSAKEQGKFLKDLNKDYRSAVGAARAQIALLIREFARLQAAQEAARLGMGSSVLIGGNWGGHAAGGVAEAGVPTWVGEQGKELLIPKTDSLVVPHAQSMAMASGGGGSPMAGAGSMTLNVTINASPGMTPGAAREIGEAFGPAVLDWGRRNNIWAR